MPVVPSTLPYLLLEPFTMHTTYTLGLGNNLHLQSLETRSLMKGNRGRDGRNPDAS